MQHPPPVVLVIAGNDPSGGAGLAADIQSITALGAHPAPVVAALTVQDTRNAYAVEPVAQELVIAQAEKVLDDLPVRAVKLGLLGTVEICRAVAAMLARRPGLPVVVDPVLVAAGGAALAETAIVDAYLEHLLPLATLVTPNALEARRFAPDAVDAATRARALLARGARAALIKGGDEDTPAVDNALFLADGARHDFRWPRLAGQFHGSGCTLASAISAELAHGRALVDAVRRGQEFTQRALAAAWTPGRGQAIPARRAP